VPEGLALWKLLQVKIMLNYIILLANSSLTLSNQPDENSHYIIYYLCKDSIQTIEFPENILFSVSVLCRFIVQILKVYPYGSV
jgi:hypothetical protein